MSKPSKCVKNSRIKGLLQQMQNLFNSVRPGRLSILQAITINKNCIMNLTNYNEFIGIVTLDSKQFGKVCLMAVGEWKKYFHHHEVQMSWQK